METTEEELDQARKKTLKVQKERDDVIEDYAQSERKISMLDKKLENANKEIAKLKDINAEQRQKLDEGEEERKQLHEMVQQLKTSMIELQSVVRTSDWGE